MSASPCAHAADDAGGEDVYEKPFEKWKAEKSERPKKKENEERKADLRGRLKFGVLESGLQLFEPLPPNYE